MLVYAYDCWKRIIIVVPAFNVQMLIQGLVDKIIATVISSFNTFKVTKILSRPRNRSSESLCLSSPWEDSGNRFCEGFLTSFAPQPSFINNQLYPYASNRSILQAYASFIVANRTELCTLRTGLCSILLPGKVYPLMLCYFLYTYYF